MLNVLLVWVLMTTMSTYSSHAVEVKTGNKAH
jgi:hypothetical protein